MPLPPEVEGASSAAAARRLAARLEAHGHEPQVRGRLAWVELDPDDPQFASLARRVTLVAAPAVLAVTAARTAAVDEALNEQDLLVLVTADPEGALARLAAPGSADVPILTTRPLGRGPARALARAGVRRPGRCGNCSRPGRGGPMTRREVSELCLRHDHHSSRGQATILVLGGLAGILIATVIVGAVAGAVGKEAAAQRAADLAAVAAARVMHDNYGRLFEPAYIRRRPNPQPPREGGLPRARTSGRAARRARPTAPPTPR